MLLSHNIPGIRILAIPVEGTTSRGPGRLAAERQAVARALAAAYPDNPAVSIGHNPDGSPFLQGIDNPPPISISHCRQLAVLAIGLPGMKIGIDCESRDRSAKLRRVASRYLSPVQMTQWGDDDDRLLTAWCIKEALYKAASLAATPLEDIPLPDLTYTTHPVTVNGRQYHIHTIPSPDINVRIIVAFSI